MNSLITVIEFIFVSDTHAIKPSDLVFSFDHQGKDFKIERKNGNIQITFLPKCPRSKIYYCDIISIFHNGNKLYEFYYLIYIGKKNTIIYDIDETSKPSFEIFFYTKDSKFNPSKLKYKSKEYTQIENYGNKYRSRIFFANVNPLKLDYVNTEIMNKNNLILENKTYHAIFRLINDKQFEVSLSRMENYFDYVEEIKQEKPNEDELKNLGETLKKFMEKYLDFDCCCREGQTSIDKRQIIYEELKKLSDDVIGNNFYHSLAEPKKKVFEKYENNHDDILSLFYNDFYLNQFFELDEIGYFSDINKFKSIKEIIDKNQSLIEAIYEKIFYDNNLNLEQKVRILKTITIFLQNSLKEKKSVFGVNYINIKTISTENPYYKSIEFLKKIISNLTEESRLFEAFLYFDSNVIQNILVKNTQEDYSYKNAFGKMYDVKQPEFLTEYGISLMSLEQIKEHLLDLLPSVIIQIDTHIKIRALFEDKTNMMVINEYFLLNNYGIVSELIFKVDPDSYIIPITMEILHEILGHGKLRYEQEKEDVNYSPLAVRDSKNNFKIQKIIKKVRLFDDTEKEINRGETGRVLEHYISENPDVIQILKKKSVYNEIINPDYWTGKNFDLLHKALNYENKNTQSKCENILGDYDNEDVCYECIFN